MIEFFYLLEKLKKYKQLLTPSLMSKLKWKPQTIQNKQNIDYCISKPM